MHVVVSFFLAALVLPPVFATDLQTEDSFFVKPETPKAPPIQSTPSPQPSIMKAPAIKTQEPLEPEPVETQPPPPKINTDNFTNEPKFFRHPLTDKGLVRIDADRNYIYDVPHVDPTRAASVRFSFYNPTLLKNPNTGITFDSLYNPNGIPMVTVDYEWMLWHTFGKFYYTVGSGVFAASGHGQFAHPQDELGLTPKESFTFVVFPTSTGVTWRLQFLDHQYFVPYLTGGGTLFAFTEIRDDNKPPKFGVSFGAYGGAGMQFNLNFLDTKSMLTLDHDYGISSVWLTAEFRIIQTLDTNFDFSANFINLGFMVEF